MTSGKKDRVPGAKGCQAELDNVGCESLMNIAALDSFGIGTYKVTRASERYAKPLQSSCSFLIA